MLVERSPHLMKIYGRLRIEDPPAVLDQVMWSFILAFLLFLLLRFIAQLTITRVLLCTFAGGLALGILPIFYLVFPSSAMGPSRVMPHTAPLLAETVCVLICGLLFYLKRLPISWAGCLAFVLLHFGLWGWMTSSYVSLQRYRHGLWNLGTWVSIAFYFGFPLIGFLSSVTWGLYVRKAWQMK